ncbi:MAG TPA: DUF5655 domain-containing protein [Pyrinomonadaceae bacterium]|nr:DUF5655 domain-containing protein [Pyrinomonadaceae bacterium]
MRRELWKCPVCKRPFANTNQSHSCVTYTVDDFLANKGPHAVALFERFSELVAECGPVITAPVKTRVGFQVRMIFAAVYKLTDESLDGHVVLARRLENPRFRAIESFSPRNHAHHFRIHSLEELDDEVKSWLKEAYKVGKQEHLTRKS